MWRPLMLHTRFTVAVAVAVAAVTLAITAVAFFVLRSDLQDQVKQELLERGVTVQHEAQRYDGHIPSGRSRRNRTDSAWPARTRSW